MKTFLIAFASVLTLLPTAPANEVAYDLTIAEQRQAPAGKPVSVLSINGGIPGPTLRFREGDTAVLRGSEWYAVRKGNAQSILGAAKSGKLKDYFDREKVRMPPMDLSDVAYDAFLKSTKPTDFKGKTVRVIELRLTGDMSRYLWSFNGKTLGEDSTIPVNKGEVLEIEFINDTMMHHPLHLHGHFFRVLNRYGTNSPLKHTVDVPPMGRRTIQFLADEEGDWFFHCHLLYHMDAGMARVFSYRAAVDPSYKPSLDPKLINPSFFMTDGILQNNMTMGNATLMKGRENYGFMWDYGFQEHNEYEIDAYWSHYFNRRFSTVAGYRFTNQDEAEDRAFAGASYLLPYFIRSSLTIDSEGDARFGLSKELQLTTRFSLYGDIEYDTNTDLEWTAGAAYLINKKISLTGSYHNEHGWGAGFGFRF